jgi:hypothetical protein
MARRHHIDKQELGMIWDKLWKNQYKEKTT